MGAVYNSLERQKLDAPKCHPNTRVAVIQRLIDWIVGDLAFAALILWLYGAAGAGKSAIAHSLAERCDKEGWLLATFFFWKSATERSSIDRFVATIAYQAARAIPALRPLIEDAVEFDPEVFHHSIDVQLNKLLLEPLQRLHSTGFDFEKCPFVIIIDGLDECQGDLFQSCLVKSITTTFLRSPLRVRILIASRPEIHIQSTFNTLSFSSNFSRLALSGEFSPDEDIYRFLEDSFETTRREHPLASRIPPSWPGPEILGEITRKSSGQFIFASTLVKYVCGDPCELPTRRLDVIRQLEPPRGEEDLPYAELNSLYNYVLSKVRGIKRIMQVLGVLIILNTSGGTTIASTYRMDTFLFWAHGETRACLSQLASIIEWDEYDNIHILHTSLQDFLCDPSRSRQFYLCRESILRDITLLGLHHVSHDMIDTSREGALLPTLHSFLSNELLFEDAIGCFDYVGITFWCLNEGVSSTPALQQALNSISIQKLYSTFNGDWRTSEFWVFLSTVFTMLHKQVHHMVNSWCTIAKILQGTEEMHSTLISDVTATCLQAFQMADRDEYFTMQIYYEHYFPILRFRFLNLNHLPSARSNQVVHIHPRTIVTRHFQWLGSTLTAQHNAIVASFFMEYLDKTAV